MTCEHCNGPGDGLKCCWAQAMEIQKFKRHVRNKFIIEVTFDLIISVCSVITDILSLVLYIINYRWEFVFLTAIPVLLPTTVFTNIYLSDESRGYCKMPSERMKKKDETGGGIKIKVPKSGANSANRNWEMGRNFSGLTCGLNCANARDCFGGLTNMFCHKDSEIRKRGAAAVKKSMSRSTKYFFGTFVLRFIAWAWYFKALIHGIKAYRSPKKFMKIESPDLHWSHDLLVRLDFLQAALENAPQCVVQLYALITQPDEQKTLGLLTLLFSFVDFVRVAMNVLWDVQKGPVIAPHGCFSTLRWKIGNFCSWTFLYAARSCSLALAFATARDWSIAIVVIGITSHVVLFAVLFSRNKYGVATEKVAVSVFISLFFLPELNATDMELLTQFYYSMTLLQNIFFIIPWNGIDYDYCIAKPPIILINATDSDGSALIATGDVEFEVFNTFDNDFEKGKFDRADTSCLIDPILIVIMVPMCTILGTVLRQAAAKEMLKFQKTVPKTQHSMKMEERIAGIYRKKWTSMTVKELSSSFIRMLRKEVAQSDPEKKKKKNISTISNELKSEFRASQLFIRNSFNILLTRPKSGGEQRKSSLQDTNDEHLAVSRQCSIEKNWSFPTRGLKQRSLSNDPRTNHNTLVVPVENHYMTMPTSLANSFMDELQDNFSTENITQENNQMAEQSNIEPSEENTSIPQCFFKPVLQSNQSSGISSEENLFTNFGVDIHAIQMEFPDGKNHDLEMGWI